MHREFVLRTAQAHLDAFDPVIHNDDSFVPQETELICGWLDTIFLDTVCGAAFSCPSYIGQVRAYSATPSVWACLPVLPIGRGEFSH